jgi:hypothetical protein
MRPETPQRYLPMLIGLPRPCPFSHRRALGGAEPNPLRPKSRGEVDLRRGARVISHFTLVVMGSLTGWRAPYIGLADRPVRGVLLPGQT